MIRDERVVTTYPSRPADQKLAFAPGSADGAGEVKSRETWINRMDRSEWTTNSKSPDNIEAFNLGYYFFNLATYSISQIVLVELSIFLSEAEDRSLLDWLNKAKENAASLKPTRCHLTRSDYEPIQPEEYRAIIDDQIAQLEAQKDVIDRIKARRDKALVHLDKKYFDETDSIQTDYPLSNDEIDDIMHLVSCILRKHYNCLLERDITSFEVSSLRNVGTFAEMCACMDASAERLRSNRQRP